MLNNKYTTYTTLFLSILSVLISSPVLANEPIINNIYDTLHQLDIAHIITRAAIYNNDIVKQFITTGILINTNPINIIWMQMGLTCSLIIMFLILNNKAVQNLAYAYVMNDTFKDTEIIPTIIEKEFNASKKEMQLQDDPIVGCSVIMPIKSQVTIKTGLYIFLKALTIHKYK